MSRSRLSLAIGASRQVLRGDERPNVPGNHGENQLPPSKATHTTSRRALDKLSSPRLRFGHCPVDSNHASDFGLGASGRELSEERDSRNHFKSYLACCLA